MRIISKFRDYYDSVQAHGMDMSRTYRRVSERHEMQGHLFQWTALRKLIDDGPLMHNQIDLLCFCGRVYVFSRIQYLIPRDTVIERGPFCNSDELREGYLALRREYPTDHWFTRRLEGLDDTNKWYKQSLAQQIDEYMQATNGRAISAEPFQLFRAPVLSIKSEGVFQHDHFSITTNPVLNDYKFVRHFDPFSCFQEIATYLGNELSQPDIAPQSVGSDEIIARTKGFDERSFRTQAPGNKKLNRAANKARKKKA